MRRLRLWFLMLVLLAAVVLLNVVPPLVNAQLTFGGRMAVLGSRLYLSGGTLNTVDVYPVGGGALVGSITGFSGSNGIAPVAPDRLYVTNVSNNTVSVVDVSADPGTIISSIATGIGIQPFDAVALGTQVFVSNYGSGSISVISTLSNTVTNTIGSVCTNPGAVAANPNLNRVYVACASEIVVIDATALTVQARFAVTPRGVAVNTATNVAYFPTTTGELIAISSSNGIAGNIALGAGGTEAAVNASTNRVYVVTSDTLRIVNTGVNPASVEGLWQVPGTLVDVVVNGSSIIYSYLDTTAVLRVAFLDLGIAPNVLPTATIGFTYSVQLVGVGAPGPYSFALASGTLPTGITLSSGGLLSGITSQSGNFNISIQITNGTLTVVQPFVLTVSTSLPTLTPTPFGTPFSTEIPSITPTPTITPTPSPTLDIATGGSVNDVQGLAIRSGPYLGASLIGVARPGIVYPVLAFNSDEGGGYTWYLIQTSERVQGWVSGRYFALDGVVILFSAQGTIFDQIDSAADTGVDAVTLQFTDLRRRPSPRSVSLAQYPPGTRLNVLGRTIQENNTWWIHVRDDAGQVGWISAANVDIRGDITLVPVR